jgi:sugar phosphate isomerase/epimerase
MPSRRNFLKITTAASAAIVMNPLESLSTPLRVKAAPGFSLTIMATNWGFPGTWDEYCAKAKAAGYDGCEIWWPLDQKDREKMFEALNKHGLKFGFLWGSGDPDFKKNQSQFEATLNDIAKVKPLYINCHSGRDFFTADQKLEAITFTTKLSQSIGIPVYHETHRGRALYSAPVTRELIERNKDLRITLDISHWCNVHESLLADQAETISTVLTRVDHIHARVGHAEGPQVSEPRAPEWDSAVKAHFAWWDTVVEAKKKEGKTLTVLTEFGPPDYMPTTPYTRQPLASQWDINVHMMNTFRKRYL